MHLDAGRGRLTLQAPHVAGTLVMDVRMVTLTAAAAVPEGL